MSSTGPANVLPYSPIGAPTIDALGTRCHQFYSAIFSGNETSALQFMGSDFHVIQSPTMPYNQSVFAGPLGALSVGAQQNEFLSTNNLTIRVFTLGESHCIANGVDEEAKLVNNTLGTFRFEFLEHSYWVDGFIQSAKPYFYNTYPIMRGQMLDKGADCYVHWKDRDDKRREAAIAAFDATHVNYDPHVV